MESLSAWISLWGYVEVHLKYGQLALEVLLTKLLLSFILR